MFLHIFFFEGFSPRRVTLLSPLIFPFIFMSSSRRVLDPFPTKCEFSNVSTYIISIAACVISAAKKGIRILPKFFPWSGFQIPATTCNSNFSQILIVFCTAHSCTLHCALCTCLLTFMANLRDMLRNSFHIGSLKGGEVNLGRALKTFL